MATMLRNENDLGTIRCSMGFEDRRPVMRLQAFIGAEPLGGPFVVKADGPRGILLQNPLPKFQLLMQMIKADEDNVLRILIEMLDSEVPYGAPLWIQIGQDSPECARIPWERIIKELTQRSTLRVPNFLRNPYMPTRTPSLAICASGTRRTDATVKSVARQLVALQAALEGTQTRMHVTVFAAQRHQNALSDLARRASKADTLDVEMAPLPSSEEVAPNSQSDRTGRRQGRVWLRWMAAHFQGRTVDGVHFISPAYARNGRGTLALTASPLAAGGGARAVPTTADDLGRLYDRLGCSIMGFSAIGGHAWQDGVSVLANNLSWARPGSIYVSDASDFGDGYPDLLRAIWTRAGLEHGARSATPAYVHPIVVRNPDALSSTNGFVTPHPEYLDALVFDDAVLRRAASPYIGGIGGASGGAFENLSDDPFEEGLGGLLGGFGGQGAPLGGGVPLGGPAPAPPAPDPKYQQMAQQLELERARISSTKVRTALEEAHDKGALKGIDFLAEVMKQ